MGAIQNSINYALGTAAIASGLTNRKTAEKAQDKLDKSEKDLAKTTAENYEVNRQQAEDAKADIKAYEQLKNNIYSGEKTAKETNVDDAGDKIDVVSNNSTNDIKGPSINDFLNSSQKVDPYATEQIMGFHALKMLDSRIAAKREVMERSRRAMMKLDPRTIRALEDKNGGNE